MSQIEREILAAALIYPDEAYTVIRHLDEKDFSHAYRPIYRTLRERLESGETVDAWDLHTSSDLSTQAIVAEIQATWVPAGKGEELAKGLRRKSTNRRVAGILQHFAARATDSDEDIVPTLLDKLMRITEPDDFAIYDTQSWMQAMKADVEERVAATQEGNTMILDMGLPKLSEALALQPTNLAIIAAETGRGKTALALYMAGWMGIGLDKPTLYCNAEMSAAELGMRLAAQISDTSAYRLRVGKPRSDELVHIRNMDERGSLWISDAMGSISAEQIFALARQYKARHNIEVLVVDYIQRLDTSDPREKEWQVLSRAAKGFKTLAQELGIVVFLLAQLTDDGKLANARAMAREADAVVTIDQLTEEERQKYSIGTHILTIQKARHAPTGNQILVSMHADSLKPTEVNTRVAS